MVNSVPMVQDSEDVSQATNDRGFRLVADIIVRPISEMIILGILIGVTLALWCSDDVDLILTVWLAPLGFLLLLLGFVHTRRRVGVAAICNSQIDHKRKRRSALLIAFAFVAWLFLLPFNSDEAAADSPLVAAAHTALFRLAAYAFGIH